jgi:hypothetical protein
MGYMTNIVSIFNNSSIVRVQYAPTTDVRKVLAGQRTTTISNSHSLMSVTPDPSRVNSRQVIDAQRLDSWKSCHRR